VPADVALTLRSPAYLDQINLIDDLSQLVPRDWSVVFKEHPALVGAISANLITRMLRNRPNVKILDPGINNFEVMKAAELIMTVNSKTGAEALMLQKPVIVLGDAFYRSSTLVTPIGELAALRELIATDKYRRSITEEDALRYFEDIWQASVPGEIYDVSPENIHQFSTSLNKSIVHELCRVESAGPHTPD
jgi:UDP-N-acetylglucosamine 2-epimerase